MQPRIDRRLKAARWHLLEQLRGGAGPDYHLRADSGGISAGAMQNYGQVVPAPDLTRAVAIDRGRRIDVVHYQIERPAVVQVDVRGAIRETRLSESPRLCHVRESKIAVVVVGKVRDGDFRHLFQEGQVFLSDPVRQGALNSLVPDVVDVVQIVWPAVDAVRDEEVLSTIVVQIGEERRPAPVSRVNSCQISYLAEAPVASVELNRVAGVLRVISRFHFQVEDVEAFGVRRGLEYLLAFRKHVEHDQVGPQVVVEVRSVDT